MGETRIITRIGRIRKALKREFELRAAPLEITSSQLQVLRRLWQGDGITTSALTCDCASDGGTVTGVLDRLERKELIRRERSQADRRVVQIWLTDAGRALQKPLTHIIEEINETALIGLEEAEQEQLIEMLEKVAHNLDA